MSDALIYTVDVDVAVRRRPTPANQRTIRCVIAVEDRGQPDHHADAEARETACLLAMVTHPVHHPTAVMPTAARITNLTL